MSAQTDSGAALQAASSGVTSEQMKARLEADLNATYVSISDKSGKFLSHFRYEIKKNRSRSHQCVSCS
jgi:hypothetical protein